MICKQETQLAKKAEAARLLEQEEKDLSRNRPLLRPTRVSGEEVRSGECLDRCLIFFPPSINA